MVNPFISIIIPTYKRNGIMLQRAIDSVINQTYTNYEVIIVDDNGINSEYVKENQLVLDKYKNSNIKYIKHITNKGANAARNTGIQNSKGDYIAFLDSDDVWEKNKLELTVRYIQKFDNEYGVFFSSYFIIDETNTYKENKPKAEGNIFEKQLFRDYVSPTSAVVVSRKCFNKVGLFDEVLPARQDYDMWIRIARYYKFSYIDMPIVYIYRDGHDSISSNYMNKVRGTEVVINKIITYLDDYERGFRCKVLNTQYNQLASLCLRNNNKILSKKFALKSLSVKKNIKGVSIYIISLMPSKTLKCAKKLKFFLKVKLKSIFVR